MLCSAGSGEWNERYILIKKNYWLMYTVGLKSTYADSFDKPDYEVRRASQGSVFFDRLVLFMR